MKLHESFDFELVYIIRQAFLTNTFESFQEIYDNFPFWPSGPSFFQNRNESEHMVYWTENHLAGILSSEALVAQKLNKSINHNRLLQFLNSRVKYGSSEYLSVVYQPYTFAALLNLVDFSSNQEYARLARQICNDIAYQYALVVNPFTGNVATAGGRTYEYTRSTTDRLKISPLCYLLVGQPERMKGFNPKNFTLAHALLTTRLYEIPYEILQVVSNRKEEGMHKQTHRLVKPVSSNEPIWILWSYGIYFSRDTFLKTISFVYENGLFAHSHFKSVGEKLFMFGKWPLVILFVLLYQIFAFFFYFMKGTWLTDVVLEVVTWTRGSKNVVVVTKAIPKGVEGMIPAQQYPCQVLVNTLSLDLRYGEIISGVKKELSGFTRMPNVKLQTGNDFIQLEIQVSSIFQRFTKNEIGVDGIDDVKSVVQFERINNKHVILTIV